MLWAVQTAPDLFASSVSIHAARPGWQQCGAGGMLRAQGFLPPYVGWSSQGYF